jgi:N-acetylglucosamine kinase-like BadF-type ATPase
MSDLTAASAQETAVAEGDTAPSQRENHDMPTVLAFDGGNSKTDILLIRADGQILGSARTAPFRPYLDGDAGALAALEPQVHELLLRAGLTHATHAAASLANADRPDEERAFEAAIVERGWAGSASVVNDTLAVLRAGTTDGIGIAVVCGAGINAIGVDDAGGVVRFPALGPLTGDWGGGHGLAEQVMWWSVRSEDGRGPATALAAAAAARLGLGSATECALAFHAGALPDARIHELVPILFDVAEAGDEVALDIIRRQTDEIVTMVRVCVERLTFAHESIPVVLGGGVLAADQPLLIDAVRVGLLQVSPRCAPQVLHAPPVMGAAVQGLDFLAHGSGGADGSGPDTAHGSASGRSASNSGEAALRRSFPATTPPPAPRT